jgi:hypothetical protein
MISLKDAAKQTGKSKATISRAITTGRMSAAKDDFGAYQIDPAELFRVFEPAPVAVKQENEPSHETFDLRQLNQKLETELAAMKRLLDELTTARDDWKRQANTLAYMLPKPEQKARGILSRLFG